MLDKEFDIVFFFCLNFYVFFLENVFYTQTKIRLVQISIKLTKGWKNLHIKMKRDLRELSHYWLFFTSLLSFGMHSSFLSLQNVNDKNKTW